MPCAADAGMGDGVTPDQLILEHLGKGPATYAQIVGGLMCRTGRNPEELYPVVAREIAAMRDAKRIESCGDGLNQCWRLPATTPFEDKAR